MMKRMSLFMLLFCAILLAIAVCLPFLALAGSATLTWNANTESDLAGYKLYQGTVSGQYGPPVDLGNVTTYTFTLPTLTTDQTYFWAITAYDFATNESGKSAEVSKLIRGVPAPAPTPTLPPPTNLRYDNGTMKWDAVPGATGGYWLRVHEIGTPYDPCSTTLYCNTGIKSLMATSITLAFKPGTQYDAWIHSVAVDGTVSAPQGTSFMTPTSPVDLAPAPPTGLTVK